MLWCCYTNVLWRTSHCSVKPADVARKQKCLRENHLYQVEEGQDAKYCSPHCEGIRCQLVPAFNINSTGATLATVSMQNSDCNTSLWCAAPPLELRNQKTEAVVPYSTVIHPPSTARLDTPGKNLLTAHNARVAHLRRQPSPLSGLQGPGGGASTWAKSI